MLNKSTRQKYGLRELNSFNEHKNDSLWRFELQRLRWPVLGRRHLSL